MLFTLTSKIIKFMNELLEKQLDELEEDAGDIGHHTIYNGVIRRERVNKLITDIRKHDEEELIKMLPEIREIKTDGFGVDFPYNKERNQTVNQIKQIIKDYYGK